MSAIKSQECPRCGATSDQNKKNCDYCKAEFFVVKISYFKGLDNVEIKNYLNHFKKKVQSAPESLESHIGLGITYLELGVADKAVDALEKAISISPDSGQAYFYSCLAKINRRRIMTMNMREVNDLINRISAAIKLDESNASYLLLLAIIKRDYFFNNKLKDTYPYWNELLDGIYGAQLDGREVASIKKYTNTPDFELYTRHITLTA
jgi:tetratricopeptide (TPR) repeat protein